MVFLDTLIALFFLCFSFSLILVVGSKKQLNTLFGFLLMLLSGMVLLSTTMLSSENVVLAILGLLSISIIFVFQIRDNLILSLEPEDVRSDNNG
jgi:hypothetical protein